MLTDPIHRGTENSSTATNDVDSSSSSSSSRPTFRDYVREGWKDLELEYQMRKFDLTRGVVDTTGSLSQGVRDATETIARNLQDTTTDLLSRSVQETKGVVTRAYVGTGRALKQSLRIVQREVKDQCLEWRSDFQVQKRLVHQDLQEFVKASRDWKRQVAANRRQEPPAEDDDQQPSHNGSDVPSPPPSLSLAEQQELLRKEIREFEATLARPEEFAVELNQWINSQLTSCRDMVDYYHERPELQEYTITKELPRMKYTVFTREGQKLTTSKDIAAYATATNVLSDKERDEGKVEDKADDDASILWRAANQSILGDVITTLTCEHGLIRPQFNTATFVNDVTITLDLGRDQPHITAECFINLTLPGCDDDVSKDIKDSEHKDKKAEGSAETQTEEAERQQQEEGKQVPREQRGRLQVAGALVGVYFCPAAEKMEARVLFISPNNQALTEEELQGVVDNLTSQ